METLSPYPVTPRSQVSHLRHTTTRNPAPTSVMQAPTRDAHANTTSETNAQQPWSASQESILSARSDASSVRQPHLQTSNSNLSQLTNDTDPTSPAIPAPERQYDQLHKSVTSAAQRAITPEDQIQSTHNPLASPLGTLSPAATNGAKRTASGHVKNAPSLPNTPMTGTFPGRRSRAGSMSSTGSRAGELAATLKSRLGYAMAKVQHGWEHKTIAEVEQLAAYKASPQRYSMSHVEYSKRPVSAGLSNGTARLSMYENYAPLSYDGTTSPPSKRRSGNFSSFMASPQQPRYIAHNPPRLQPSADIRPGSMQQTYYSAPSSQQIGYNNAMSPPRTPMNGHPRRPPTIRTDTQTAEAERDALQALYQLGSPHASQISRNTTATSQTSSSQESPLRNEFPTPRRVTFARSVSEASSARGSSASDGQ
ncbi:hypothetical protein LTR86_009156 [Recurvomyces mirabilis]|nr:hypothetical protein LTR86_009156 [Recurvomyces mirabilis]